MNKKHEAIHILCSIYILQYIKSYRANEIMLSSKSLLLSLQIMQCTLAACQITGGRSMGACPINVLNWGFGLHGNHCTCTTCSQRSGLFVHNSPSIVDNNPSCEPFAAIPRTKCDADQHHQCLIHQRAAYSKFEYSHQVFFIYIVGN